MSGDWLLLAAIAVGWWWLARDDKRKRAQSSVDALNPDGRSVSWLPLGQSLENIPAGAVCEYDPFTGATRARRQAQ